MWCMERELSRGEIGWRKSEAGGVGVNFAQWRCRSQ